jgi:hypothetical protein
VEGFLLRLQSSQRVKVFLHLLKILLDPERLFLLLKANRVLLLLLLLLQKGIIRPTAVLLLRPRLHLFLMGGYLSTFWVFLRVLGAIPFGASFGLIVGVALEGDADGLAVGRLELELSAAAQHVHQLLDDLLVLLHCLTR